MNNQMYMMIFSSCLQVCSYLALMGLIFLPIQVGFFVGDIFISNVCVCSVLDLSLPMEITGIRNMHNPFKILVKL